MKSSPKFQTVLKCIFLISFLAITSIAKSQNCACTIEEVNSNSVTPCDLVIGPIDTVATVVEFWDALNQLNIFGGNRTILIANGIYEMASTNSFPYIPSSTNNVVIRSLSGNRDSVVIRGAGMLPTSTTEDGILISGSNVTIADLTIREVGNHGIQVSGHNFMAHNIRIQDTYEQMIKGSTSASDINNGIVQCSFFEYTAGVGPNWYIGGLDIHKGNNWIVRDNVFKNISSPGSSLAEHAIHFWDNSSDNIVERNMIFNCDRGIGFGLGTNGPQNEGGIIRNNMIYNDGAGLFHDVGIGLESSPNTRVYNNTIFIEYDNAIEYRFETTVNADIINNLTNRAITSRDGGTGNLQTNFTSAEEAWFIDINSGDLHLAVAAGSVVEAGSDLSDFVEDDIDQVERPLNSAYDIGAHEFGLIVGIEDLSIISNIETYPNPVIQHLNIVYKGEQTFFDLRVIDVRGQLVKNLGLIQLSENPTQLNVFNIPDGVYFLTMQNQATFQTLKLLIK